MQVPREIIVPPLEAKGLDLLECAGVAVRFDGRARRHRLSFPDSIPASAVNWCHGGTMLCYALAPGEHLHVTPGRAFPMTILTQRENAIACQDDPWFYAHVLDLDYPAYLFWAGPGFSSAGYDNLLSLERAQTALPVPEHVQKEREVWRATARRPVRWTTTPSLERLEAMLASDEHILHRVSRSACIRETERTLIAFAARYMPLLITWQDWDGAWTGDLYELHGKRHYGELAPREASREAIEERFLGKEGVEIILGQWQDQ